MNIDGVIQLAVKARAAELIAQIENGEISYKNVMAELRGNAV